MMRTWDGHAWICTTSSLPCNGISLPYLYRVVVYMDDFCALAQGDITKRPQAHRYTFHCIDLVFLNGKGDNVRQEPNKLKIFRRGNETWKTCKKIIGWLVDNLRLANYILHSHWVESVLKLFQPSKHFPSAKRYWKLIGDLRSLILDIPGDGGLLCHLRSSLRCYGHVPLTPRVHAELTDWLRIFQYL